MSKGGGASCGLGAGEARTVPTWQGVTCKGCPSKHIGHAFPQTVGLRAKDALDFVDSLDLPDGAALSMAAEMSGMDYDDFIGDLYD